MTDLAPVAPQVRRWRRLRRATAATLSVLVLLLLCASWLAHHGMARMHAQGEALLQAHPEWVPQQHQGMFQVRTGPADRPALVLVHGAPGSWHNWSELLLDPTLHQRFQLIAVDRPGYGGTHPGVAEPSMALQAERVVAAVEDVAGPLIWVGHSFGASIAARVAMDHPDRVQGLVLLAGAMDPALEQPRWFHHLGTTAVARLLLPEALEICNYECLAFDDDLVSMADRWRHLSMPVVVMHGTKDRLARFEHAPWTMKRLAPGRGKLVVLDGAGHLLMWKQVPAVAQALHTLADDLAIESMP